MKQTAFIVFFVLTIFLDFGPCGISAQMAAVGNLLCTDLESCIADPASAGKTILISTPVSIKTITVPPDRAIMVTPGGSLHLPPGQAVTFLGRFDAPPEQVITGSGKINFGPGSVREVYPQWFGARGDGVTDSTAAFARSIASLSSGGVMKLIAGVYRGSLSVRRSDIAIVGAGSHVTTIKLPDGQGTAPNVLELGDTAAGNDAIPYERLSVSGLTLDGNRDKAGQPATDLTGWGMPATMISHSRFSDLRAINCWNGGFGFFINSNYNTGYGMYVANSGFSKLNEPGFDLNSSKYNSFTGITVENCNYGVRVLDNCWGNSIDAIIANAAVTGFVYNNQLVNESHSNNIRVVIEGGCRDYGISVGPNCRSSRLDAIISGITGTALYLVKQVSAHNNPAGMIINLTTRYCGRQSARIDGDANILTINSFDDGRTGQPGQYVISVAGNRNQLAATITDSKPGQLRGVEVRPEAEDTEINHLVTTIMEGLILRDAGKRTFINHGQGWGKDIGSATTIAIPFKGELFAISGAETVTGIIAGAENRGRRITLTANAPLRLLKGRNLKLRNDFTGAAHASITLRSDGVNWYEISREDE